MPSSNGLCPGGNKMRGYCTAVYLKIERTFAGVVASSPSQAWPAIHSGVENGLLTDVQPLSIHGDHDSAFRTLQGVALSLFYNDTDAGFELDRKVGLVVSYRGGSRHNDERAPLRRRDWTTFAPGRKCRHVT